MTTTKKLLLGFGTLTTLLVLFTGVLIIRLRSVEKDILQQAKISRPRSDETRQIEISALGFALAVRTFSQTADPKYRREASEKKDNVERHLTEYEKLATTARHGELASGFAARWRSFRELGQSILDAGDKPYSREELLRFANHRVELENFIDNEMQAEAVEMHDAGVEMTFTSLRDITTLSLILLTSFLVTSIMTSSIVGRSILMTEKSLQEKGEMLHVTLASIGDAVMTTDNKGKITFLNRVAEDLTGWTQIEAEGRSAKDIFHIVNETSRETVASPVDMVLEKGVIVGLANHTILVAKDGTEIQIDDSGAPIRDPDGILRGVILVFRDITERRRAEEKLRKSEEQYRTLFNSIDEGFCSVEILFDDEGKPRDYRFMELNPAFEKLTGLENAEGKTALELVPDLEDFWIKTYGRVAITGEAARFENYAQSMNRWFDVYAARIGDASSRRVAVVFNNITERKISEEALRSSDERMRLATEATGVGVWEWNVITGQIRWDAQMFRIYGMTPTKDWYVNYTDWSESVFAEDLPLQERVLQATIKNRGRSTREFRIRRRDDGEVRYVQAVETIRSDDKGRAEWVVGTNLDITDRKLAEQELQASEEFNRTVLESSPDCVKILDLEGRLEYLNFNGKCLLEIDDFAAFKNEFWWNLWPEEVQPVVKAAVAKALRGEMAYFQAFSPTTKGTAKWWDVAVAPIPDADGSPKRLISVSRDITENKKAEENLRLWEERFRLASDAGGALVYDVDLTGERPTIAHGLERISGYANEEWDRSADWWHSLIHPEDLPKHLKNYEDQLKTGGTYKATHRLWHKDGTWRWVEDTGQFIKDASGTVVQLIGAVVDVTKYREAEESLRYQLQLTQNITDTAAVAIFVTDGDGNITFINAEAEKIFGYTPTELAGKSFHEQMHFQYPDGRPFPQGECEFGRVYEDGKAVRAYEGVFFRKDGSPVFAIASNMPIMENGKCTTQVMTLQDVTERRKTEEKLRESEEKFRILSDTAPALIWFDDADGKCRYVNQQYLDFTGKTLEEIEEAGIKPCLNPEDSESYMAALVAARTGQKAFHHRVRIRRHDGEWRWIESHAQPLFGDDGKYLGHVGVSPDITASVEAEEGLSRSREELEKRVDERTAALAEANEKLKAESAKRLRIEKEAVKLLKQIVTVQEEERSRIARDLHDELGQQLTALRLKLEGAKEICNEEPVCDEIDATQAIAQRIDADVGFLAWELRPAGLAETGLPTTLNSYVKEWSRFSSIEAELHVKGFGNVRPSPEVEINLYRIVQEGLNNANKYAKAKTVSVLLEKQKYDISLIIEDDGIGFNPEKDPAEKKGLGLIGMLERVTLLGGKLEIESSPGNGTTIYVRVPAAEDGIRQRR